MLLLFIGQRLWPRRILSFFSIASIATSFRSRCDSVLRPPESSTHRSPEPTPQVGQETVVNCFGVTPLILVELDCDSVDAKSVRFGTLFHVCHPNQSRGIQSAEEDRWEESFGTVSALSASIVTSTSTPGFSFTLLPFSSSKTFSMRTSL
jgi:hypothetical protein